MGVASTTALSLLLSSVVAFRDAAQGDRTLIIENRCSEVVRVGRTGGQGVSENRTAYPDTGCPPGQTLNPYDMDCYWDLPSPDGGPWQTQDLQPNQSIMLTLSHPAQNGVVWSGIIWGSTGCDKGRRVCETAICFSGNLTQNGECPTYSGPVGPVTRAEFTLQSERSDFYDISLINGVNLPIEMKPNLPLDLDLDAVLAAAGMTGTARNYWCGNPGGITAYNNNLSDCSWSFNPTNIPVYGDQSVSLTLVANSTDPNVPNKNCSKDSDCPQGQVCGTLEQLNPLNGGPLSGLFPGRCGRFIGLWNANEICVWADGVKDRSFPNDSPFRCKIFSELYGCLGSYGVSGYNPACNPLNNMVCGCPSWESVGINAPPTSPCQCNSREWNQTALPWIKWMKRACPTAYTFPFDDTSSTFQCQYQDPDAGNKNTVGYTITFCPGGRALNRNVATSSATVGTDRIGTYLTVFAAAAAAAVIFWIQVPAVFV